MRKPKPVQIDDCITLSAGRYIGPGRQLILLQVSEIAPDGCSIDSREARVLARGLLEHADYADEQTKSRAGGAE